MMTKISEQRSAEAKAGKVACDAVWHVDALRGSKPKCLWTSLNSVRK